MSCSNSLCEIGAGAKGLGACLKLAREGGLEPAALAGPRVGAGAGGAFSIGFSGPVEGLIGELACAAASVARLRFGASFEIDFAQSSKGVPISSSKRSSRPPLMKPESGSVTIGGRTGLDGLGNPQSKTGGEEGILIDGSNRPW
jgi:hypothetical protein